MSHLALHALLVWLAINVAFVAARVWATSPPRRPTLRNLFPTPLPRPLAVRPRGRH